MVRQTRLDVRVGAASPPIEAPCPALYNSGFVADCDCCRSRASIRMYQIQPQHDFFVGIDSDGCVFDTMELKHKECFIPNIIKFYGLQSVSKLAREVAEFVNLYSTSRGVNRFPGLVETLRLLKEHPGVLARGKSIDVPEKLAAWVQEESRLGNPALEAKIKQTGDDELKQALAWSIAVNESIAAMVEGVPPFPMVRDSFAAMAERADLLVVSSTPTAALESEWQEHDIEQFVVAICGQEAGSKKETLTNAKQYAENHSLMIGDAPGDRRAAEANNCLFFPIIAGDEVASWERLYKEGVHRFFELTYAGDYQDQLNAEFEASLPAEPSWDM